MANNNVKVAAAELQRAAVNIKGNIWAIQRDFHDQQTQLKKEMDDLTKRIRECEALMHQAAPEDTGRRAMLLKEIVDSKQQLAAKQQILHDNEQRANQVVHEKEAAAAELASKAGELAQKAGDPKFS